MNKNNYKNIISDTEYDFDEVIIERGEEYYYSNHVLSVVKSYDTFIATVSGSENKIYDVKITYDRYDDEYNYECSCPCDYPCKHEYAVLLAIENKDYTEFKLKKEIKKQYLNIQKLIKKIPANELKQYLTDEKYDNKVSFDMNSFNEYFKKYLPYQQYTYYYNNLYNNLILNNINNVNIMLNEYIIDIKNYISLSSFNESFKIIKAIIEANIDTNNLDKIMEIIPLLSMFLRVTYRKCNNKTKEEIDKWINNLKINNYYNNYYLEDMILTININ